MLSFRSVFAATTLVVSFAAHAQVSVSDAWVRGTVPQQQATAAFMQLKAPQAMRLVGVRTSAAKVSEIHEMKREGDVMRMQPVAGIDLPAGQTVALTPGGLHLMLMGLNAPLQAGQTVELELQLDSVPPGKPVTQRVQAAVRALGAAGHDMPAAHKH